MYNPVIIAEAFNQNHPKRNWKAKALTSRGTDPVVMFDSHNLVQLHLNCTTGQWSAKFIKLNAAWGDYIAGLRRSMYTVLHTLTAAALPFEAPLSLDDMVLTITTRADGTAILEVSDASNASTPATANFVGPAEQNEEYQIKFAL